MSCKVCETNVYINLPLANDSCLFKSPRFSKSFETSQIHTGTKSKKTFQIPADFITYVCRSSRHKIRSYSCTCNIKYLTQHGGNSRKGQFNVLFQSSLIWHYTCFSKITLHKFKLYHHYASVNCRSFFLLTSSNTDTVQNELRKR